MIKYFVYLILISFIFAEFPTEPNVLAEKFSGEWWSLMFNPTILEAGCYCQKTLNTLKDAVNKVSEVVDTCRLWGYSYLTIHSPLSISTPVDETGSKLSQVSMGGLVKAKYYIFKIVGDYEYALTGTPDGKLLWILSRNPQFNEQIVKELTNYAVSIGINTSKLEKTNQTCGKY